MKEKIKKYLIDIIIIAGVLIFSYNILRPTKEVGNIIIPTFPGYRDYHTKEKVFGIFLIAAGTGLAIRKYLSLKNKGKN